MSTLHDFLIAHHDAPIEDPEELKQLDDVLKETTDHIAHEHTASPEDVEDFRKASEHIKKALGHLSLSEIVVFLDAAVAGNNPTLEKIAFEKLEERFPEATAHPGLDYANQRTRDDYSKAIEMAKENGTLVSDEIAEAAAINDEKDGINFNDIIRVSGWTAKEQDGKLNEDQLRELREVRTRIKERQELAAKGVLRDKSFDDAVRWVPNFDDDDEDENESERAA